MDVRLVTLGTFTLLTTVLSFSINDCFQTETTFCFGSKGNDTSYDPRCGCLGNNDCDVFVFGVISSAENRKKDPKSIKIEWHLKIRRINLTENQIRRVHFYITKVKPCPDCNLKDYSIFVPLNVIALDVHRQKTLAEQPLRDNLQVIIYTKEKDGIEKEELRNPSGSFHVNDTALQYEGEDRTFVTVSFESRPRLFYENNKKVIYNIDLFNDEVYPGIVSMIETVNSGTTLIESVEVSANVVASKVKLFEPFGVKSTKNPWIIALIVALVLLIVIASLCCCYCWKRKRDAKELNKIHANYN